MQAYGVAKLVRDSMGVFTEVYSEDYGTTEYLGVTSELTAERLKELQALSEALGWEVTHHPWHNGGGDDVFLAIHPQVPQEPTE